MSLLTAFFCCLSLFFAVPHSLQAGTNTTPHEWQQGELVSRKTIPAGHRGIRYKYVYRLRSSNANYVVVANEPLRVDLQVPLKFATTRRHLLIQDPDGREYKVFMKEREKTAFGPWR